MAKKKDLVKIIQDNPGCIVTIDNDSWSIQRESRENNPYLEEEAKGYSKLADEWDQQNELAREGETFKEIKGAGDYCGCSYGGDVLQALAKIVGIKVESV